MVGGGVGVCVWSCFLVLLTVSGLLIGHGQTTDVSHAAGRCFLESLVSRAHHTQEELEGGRGDRKRERRMERTRREKEEDDTEREKGEGERRDKEREKKREKEREKERERE